MRALQMVYLIEIDWATHEKFVLKVYDNQYLYV